jgi:hypothetical protein
MSDNRMVAEFGTMLYIKFIGIFVFLGSSSFAVDGEYLLAFFGFIGVAMCLHSKVFLLEDRIRFRLFGPFVTETPCRGYQYGMYMNYIVYAARGWKKRPVFFDSFIAILVLFASNLVYDPTCCLDL